MRSLHIFLKNFREQSGLTLIEAILTVFILSIVLVGAFSLMVSNLKNADGIKNNLIASGLAQEGLEVVRNIRDTDWLLSNPYGTLGPLPDNLIPDGTYRVQYDSRQMLSLSTNPKLKYDSGTGLYNYLAGVDSLFSRTIQITRTSADSFRVEVTVQWNERGNTKEIKAESHYYNWLK